MGNRFRSINQSVRESRRFAALSLMALAFVSINCGTSQKNARRQTNPEAFSRSLASISNPESHLLSKLMWPLAQHRVSQEFDPGSPHDGIDIPAPRGARIYAPADGRVVYAGHKFHGYGKMIVIEHNSRLATLFGHCSKLLVKSGEVVRRGSLIGLVGRTGHATANHLHFEVRIDKIPVDPRGYLP